MCERYYEKLPLLATCSRKERHKGIKKIKETRQNTSIPPALIVGVTSPDPTSTEATATSTPRSPPSETLIVVEIARSSSSTNLRGNLLWLLPSGWLRHTELEECSLIGPEHLHSASLRIGHELALVLKMVGSDLLLRVDESARDLVEKDVEVVAPADGASATARLAMVNELRDTRKSFKTVGALDV